LTFRAEDIEWLVTEAIERTSRWIVDEAIRRAVEANEPKP